MHLQSKMTTTKTTKRQKTTMGNRSQVARMSHKSDRHDSTLSLYVVVVFNVLAKKAIYN